MSGCAGCGRKKPVTMALMGVSMDEVTATFALPRAEQCDGCRYLNKDLTCQIKTRGARYIPSAVRHQLEHCPFQLW